MKAAAITRTIVLTSFVGVFSLLMISILGAQNSNSSGANPSDKPTPRLANGKPDFSGFYNNTSRYRGDLVDEEDGDHVVVKSPDGSVFFSYGGGNVGPGLVAE